MIVQREVLIVSDSRPVVAMAHDALCDLGDDSGKSEPRAERTSKRMEVGHLAILVPGRDACGL